MICANCQNVLKDDARFCGKCGTPVAVPASDALICLVCNTPIKPGATFCGKCGTPTGGADSDMTVILPKAGAKPAAPPASPAAVPATPVPPPVSGNAEDGATVILPASHPARQPAPEPARPPAPKPVRMSLPESAAETVMCLDSLQHASKKKRPDAAARAPSSSLAQELEKQLGGAEGIERKGKTAVAAIFAALGVLVLVALGAGWYLTRSSMPPAPVATAAVSEPVAEPAVSVPVAMESPPMEAASAPVVVEALPVIEPAPAPAPAQPQAEPTKPTSKPAARPVKKLSEEEEYLRQIRRQLEQQR
ncbi:zinc-ribbon domain-containing protein [Uliginosibacterium sp. 31-16]|uniref:zinc-ribbon domain-containing protein n=1 Tax=Uliginosibacterium sp. 31-16 TaxID=3068315 RepID=UPI00273E5E61|nr:zinc-ribbon domain-containing protein [Uliginosibacterium sp. 31-16]MDP5239972.1 zinc-ribbon domain-containing protein [Uliginosibacterium sp. 31-16]